MTVSLCKHAFPLLLGPTVFTACLLLPAPVGLGPAAWLTLGVAMWMAIWWSTEAIPLPVTALLPVSLFPLLDIAPLAELSAAYAHPIIFLFLGGFLLGTAMQRWNLHRRIAVQILQRVGREPRQQIAGFMLATAFLSMWVSNTATSIMMLPIGLSVLSYHNDDSPEANNYRVALLLAIAYSASIGGIATLIGTPPNALLAAYLKDSHGIEVGFAQWMLVGLPVSVSLLMFTWWWLCRRPLPRAVDAQASGEVAELGAITPPQRRVLVLFLLTAAAWIAQPLLARGLPGLSDTGIAMIAGLLLFVLPAGQDRARLLSWKDAEQLPWGILLLFGGGLALAAAIQGTGLASWIAAGIGQLQLLPTLAVVTVVVAVILFLTEVSSNTATTAAFLPLMGALAMAQGASPLLYAVPAALAASCAFMMPVATPPNAVVFGSGQVSIGEMIRVGFALNLFATGLVSGLAYLLVNAVFL